MTISFPRTALCNDKGCAMTKIMLQPDAAERFMECKMAYQLLIDPSKRKQYDRQHKVTATHCGASQGFVLLLQAANHFTGTEIDSLPVHLSFRRVLTGVTL